MSKGVPSHYDMLTDDDVQGYQNLHRSLQSAFSMAPRSSKISDNFEGVVDQLREYVVCGDPMAELRRALVCGIMWIDDTIAINTRQLCIIIGKCKSSVNSGFQAIGYTTIPTDANTATALTKAYPFMKTDFGEMRQWTFRRMPAAKETEVKEADAWENTFSPAPDEVPFFHIENEYESPFELQGMELTNDVFGSVDVEYPVLDFDCF